MIESLWLSNVRNLERLEFSPGAGCNLILGRNGSGKTALLESIHILGSGRSFLYTDLDHVIRFGADKLGIAGDAHRRRLRFEKQRGELPSVSANGELIRLRSEQVRTLPMAVAHPESQGLVSGAPALRRQYLDGVVFHVEHSFHRVLQDYRRALRQRNEQLRSGSLETLAHWDAILLNLAEQMTQARTRVTDQLQEQFDALQAAPELSRALTRFAERIQLTLRRGWPEDLTLEQTWARDLQTDRETGHTRQGPHRADLQISVGARRVRGVLSRAEQRLLSLLLVLAKVRLLASAPGSALPVLLLDDIASELDAASLEAVAVLVRSQQIQSFWTSPDPELPERLAAENPQVFHVEQAAENR
ncbi:MAG: DNA replication and repair protein RecF [Gammaproteobacteria bacterium AqS3]|nr:DNA replication and repair protein RecF [Gammaproteobacteria bacterium AqS3]